MPLRAPRRSLSAGRSPKHFHPTGGKRFTGKQSSSARHHPYATDLPALPDDPFQTPPRRTAD
eukprot:2162941-Karenia_brevis.AAC.1